MAGYTRQSLADIQDGEDIIAAPLNAEFNQLQDSFNAITGHSHDGTIGNGPKLDISGSTTGTLPDNRLPTTMSGKSFTGSIEVGRVDGVAGTFGVEFHSGATAVDYDSRIVASGGTGAVGNGALTYTAATHTFSGTTYMNTLSKNSDTSVLSINGGLTVGANIELYGGSHATLANQLILDGNTILMRNANGSGTPTVQIGGNNVWHAGNMVIGTNVQAYDAGLQSISGLTTAADRMIYTTAADTYAVATLTSTARTLLDDTSTTAMRTTLDVYSTSQVDSAIAAVPGAPAGSIIMHAASTAPAGYLKCNGAAVSRSTYAALFAVIGTTWGAGDGSTTFNVPELRGEFVRAWDDARGVDSGRTFASAQAANISSHTHAIDPPSTSTSSDSHTHTFSGTTSSDAHTHTVTSTGSTDSQGDHTHTIPVRSNLNAGTSFPIGSPGSGTAGSPASGTAGAHTHNVTVSGTTSSDSHTHTYSGTTSSDAHTHTVDIASFTSGAAGSGTDTRPRNIALLYCIKT